jgi:hypothetical protein
VARRRDKGAQKRSRTSGHLSSGGSEPIRLLPRATRDQLLGDHIAVVEEFAVDLPTVALTDHDGDEADE